MTCLRETLASRRPSLKALTEFGSKLGGNLVLAGRISAEWRGRNCLAPGRLELAAGELVSLEDVDFRHRLERELCDVLAVHGLERLDVTEMRSRIRPVTQAISRWLYDRGVAGIVYRSNLDSEPCVALFEGRAALVPDGHPEPLIQPLRDLDQVCREFGLVCTGV